MTDYEKLEQLCIEKLTNANLNNEIYTKRLQEELKEINAQDAAPYFLELKDKYENENNLLIPFLLGICDEFDIDKPAAFEWGDMPDIDVDYIPTVRTYLKETYAKEIFGEKYVCNIATYTTFGLRSVLIDMAKVFDLDRKEILNITTNLDVKDDEGEILTWDKAIELYEDLRKYLEKNPEMADAAKHILHRNRNMGMHASGLIISGVPINDFIPLVKIKEGAGSCSSWVEGLFGSDLTAVGLVKFDFLALESSMKIALATRIIKATSDSIGAVSALPGQSNWTDLSYLEDPKSLKMANDGDLKMIFQFDGSDGIRRLAKQGGVTRFDDLPIYASLFRPSAIRAKMHDAYCRRKKGTEKYETNELLDPILSSTYYCLVYQEQAIKILHEIGKIPLKYCETIRKAISKKKVDKFIKYKDMFIENAEKTLGKEKAVEIFKFIEFFSSYGFNCSHATAYSYISSRMLYLKANYPLAFYTSFLEYTKATGPKDYAKLKDYKQETLKHGIKVNRVDINKSKAEMCAVNNEIYWSFSKIKGIGDDVAKLIEQHQPYSDYTDFLKRFGTDAKVNYSLIALRLFPEDPVQLCQYYESYKNWKKKKEDRKTRYEATLVKYKAMLRTMVNQPDLNNFEQDNFESLRETLPDRPSRVKFKIAWDRMHKSIRMFANKNFQEPTLSCFEPCEIKEEYLKLLQNQDLSEETYYGFVWDHPIEKQRLYNHNTFEKLDTEIGPIDVLIKDIKEKKGPKATYYSAAVEDETSQVKFVTIWANDYKTFSLLLQKGKYVRMTVNAPSNGFTNYTLYSPKRWEKKKEFDTRVISIE